MPKSRRPIIDNTPTGWLKLIALAFMFTDHAGKMLFGNMIEMRLLGRIAFPLYAWCMVVGFHYTRSVPKYLLRIGLMGVASQPLYMLALDHMKPVNTLAGIIPALGAELPTSFLQTYIQPALNWLGDLPWYQPNIFFTLLLGLSALWAVQEKRAFSHIWGPLAALALAQIIGADYGWKGVLLILTLYAVQGSRGALAAAMICFCLFWGSTSNTVQSAFGGALLWIYQVPGFSGIASSMMRLQAMAVLALPLMLLPIPRKHDLRMPKWLGYAIYPGHLLVLLALEKLWPLMGL